MYLTQCHIDIFIPELLSWYVSSSDNSTSSAVLNVLALRPVSKGDHVMLVSGHTDTAV